MDELTAVRQLLAEPPAPAPRVIAAAQTRLERAVQAGGTQAGHGTPAARRWSAPRRSWRLAAAAGLAAVVAAGVVTVLVRTSTGAGVTGPARPPTVQELAYRAAAAAARQPSVRPGHWVFWREKEGGPGCGKQCGTFHVWTTANSQRAAWVYQGQLVSLGAGPFDGQPHPGPIAQGGWGYGAETGKIPVRYAALSALPRDPGALARHLGRLHLPGWGSAGAREFRVIEELLTSYVMPPGRTAEMYRALGAIPGVRVDGHAVDVAGRPGIGFISPASPDGGNLELIFDPHTYRLMGDSLLNGHHQQLLDGTAILQQALVSGPGAWPHDPAR